MAEFSEVIRQKKRMCNSVICCKCDIYRLCGEDLSECPRFINNNPKKAEEVIMAWAAKHPEPVYPTWGEWFVEQSGFVKELKNATNPAWEASIAIAMFRTPISADSAQKLGVDPKEGA